MKLKLFIVNMIMASMLFSGCSAAVESRPAEQSSEGGQALVTETAVETEESGEEQAEYHYRINEVLPQFGEHLSAAEVAVGNDIIKAVHEGRSRTRVNGLDDEGLVRGWYAALLSNPIVNTASIDMENRMLSYQKSRSKHKKYVREWESQVETLIRTVIKKSYNDLLKAAAIERRIAFFTEYNDEEGSNIEKNGVSGDEETNALTVIMDHVGICNGYARAMAYLLNEIGVPVYIVSTAGHEWNMIKIGKEWVHVDATFDSGVFPEFEDYGWDYFGMSDKKRLKSLESLGDSYTRWHIPYAGDEKTVFEAPKCGKNIDTSDFARLLADGE